MTNDFDPDSTQNSDNKRQSDATNPPKHESSGSNPLTGTGSPDSTSRSIGHYKLLQQIGEGGMGTVWMAEQQVPLRRRVALKVIRADLGSKEVIARFEAERQALAMMDHPNIAKVLDAGTTDDGHPYFVMELVQGIAINEYCDRNRLTPNERLKLFVPVCRAVQHAHQKGIIHRDLKPSNVLVALHDGKPMAQVIDFGLAKALQSQTRLTDKTLYTEFGRVVGTLQYMSPEQAMMDALNVDTRSDIYSLGVMLYELLAGSTPVEPDTIRQHAMLQVLELIREKEPPRPSDRLRSRGGQMKTISDLRQIQPSRLQTILRGELDWIVMKALEKDRTRRYETASGMADDVTRYLDGEPVFARPPSVIYKFEKLISRYRFQSVVILLAAVIVMGIFTTVWVDKRVYDEATFLAMKIDYGTVMMQSRADSARPLIDAGEYSQAEKLLEEAIDIGEDRIPDFPLTHFVKILRAECHLRQGEEEIGKSQLLVSYEQLSEAIQDGATREINRYLAENVKLLVDYYELQGDSEKMEMWKARHSEVVARTTFVDENDWVSTFRNKTLVRRFFGAGIGRTVIELLMFVFLIAVIVEVWRKGKVGWLKSPVHPDRR